MASESLESSQYKARLLLVDDTPANLVALKAVLEPLGQELVLARSGAEALKCLLDGDFAAILLDVQMPGLDGFETAALVRARSKTRRIPIMFLTAASKEARHVFRGYAEGAVDYLVKPFDADILRAKVAVFVELWQAREQIRVQGERLLQAERDAHERSSALRYQQLMDMMPQCVLGARADGTFYLTNHTWMRYTGLTLEQTSQDGLIRAAHTEDRERLGEAWAQARLAGTPVEVECRLRSVDGSYRWFLVRALPERSSDGSVIGWLASATDVDDHRRDRDELKLANETKDAFLAAASHELRTPLAAAKAQAQLTLRRVGSKLDPSSLNLLTSLGRQIDRMTKLVDDILDVSRLQTGRLSLEQSRFDLAARLREWVERTQTLSSDHAIKLTVGAPMIVMGDRDRIDQVVTNLLTNAIRYSPKSTEIDVSATTEGDHVRIAVRDHGLGVPAEKQRQIFERFARLDGSKHGGLGLGLTIAQGIVEQHGGKIWVESSGQPGEGSTFFVELPRGPVDETQKKESALAEA